MKRDAVPITLPWGLRLKRRWVAMRNRVIGNPRFQAHAARNPLFRFVARRKAAAMFDLVAGFVYTQTLRAVVESGLLDLLAQGPTSSSAVASSCELERPAAVRLLRAGQALQLVEDVGGDCWMLGEQGAALRSNNGAQAMIRHHDLLYRDLVDPLALLRDNRSGETGLSRFWAYGSASADAAEYSNLMAISQEMVAEQVLATKVLARTIALLDVGGGLGVFTGKVSARYPAMRVGVFDLPPVIEAARRSAVPERLVLHPGSFFTDPLPVGYDTLSLVRILHDHDDDRALALLRAARAALAPGQRLIIAEPMAGIRGAERMGDAYFGLYLWAMRSGRPRRPDEIGAMLLEAGFASWRSIPTPLPLIASVIVALA